VSEASLQASLFDSVPELPDGMRYAPELISPAEERALLQKLPALPFKEFEFHGFLGKRRTVSFGWHYDFNGGGLKEAGELPDFLLPLRQRAAEFGHLEPSALASCTFRLRRKINAKWIRRTLTAEPRSAYLLRGGSRTEWEQSIPPLETLRYSVTFRTVRKSVQKPVEDH
jgi:hypothetical protein